MRAEEFDIQIIIDSLQGTGQTLSSCVEEHYPEMSEDDLISDDHDAIDNQIFLCEQCGWWCEQSEANENPDGGGDLCNDCHAETDEEE